jgi:hypothetical protein
LGNSIADPLWSATELDELLRVRDAALQGTGTTLIAGNAERSGGR